MKTILFPTDFSDNSMHAAQYAAMLARRFDAKLVLLHVFTNIITLASEPQMLTDTGMLEEQLVKVSTRNLEVFAEKLILNTGLPSIQIEHTLEYGFVAECIVNTSKNMEVDMIVMGTKGVTNLLDKWVGSNAENVVQAAECPVWVVPNGSQLIVPQTFIYAADYEENEALATQTLLEFTTPLGATCKVIHIHEYFDMDIMDKTKELVKDLKQEFKGKNITFKDLNRKEIVEGIETYTKTHNPDVLALAVYEKSLFSNWFNSSITKHFVDDAKIPMLIFKKEKT
jgi:nucleotide-binding universal stress UspA family protein